MRISDWSSDVGSSDLGLMVDEGRYDERVEPFGINRRLPSERADRTVLGCGIRSQPQPDILRTIILLLRGTDSQLVGAAGHAQDRKSAVEGKSGSVRAGLGGGRAIKKKNLQTYN